MAEKVNIAPNFCVDTCRIDFLAPNPQKKKPPIVIYPDESWYCGCCVEDCPRQAIKMLHPLNKSIVVKWKRKETGEYFRLGMKNSPPPNTRPPSK